MANQIEVAAEVTLNTATTRLQEGLVAGGLTTALPPITLQTLLSFLESFLAAGACNPTPTPVPATTAQTVYESAKGQPLLTTMRLAKQLKAIGFPYPLQGAFACIHATQQSTVAEITNLINVSAII